MNELNCNYMLMKSCLSTIIAQHAPFQDFRWFLDSFENWSEWFSCPSYHTITLWFATNPGQVKLWLGNIPCWYSLNVPYESAIPKPTQPPIPPNGDLSRHVWYLIFFPCETDICISKVFIVMHNLISRMSYFVTVRTIIYAPPIGSYLAW